MFVLFKVLEDGIEKILCFAGLDDARSFENFVRRYMNESGVQNNWDAYWLDDESEVIQCDKVPHLAKTHLNGVFMANMRHALTAALFPETIYFCIGRKNGAISFSSMPMVWLP